MKSRTKEEIEIEIRRVKEALDKTDSDHLKKQYGVYLHRLKKQLKQERKNDDQRN